MLNEVTIKNVNDKTAGDMDRDINKHLKDAVDADQVLRDRDIDFDVNNGAVTVKGTVHTAAEKNKVTQLVQAAPGVKLSSRNFGRDRRYPITNAFRHAHPHVML